MAALASSYKTKLLSPSHLKPLGRSFPGNAQIEFKKEKKDDLAFIDAAKHCLKRTEWEVFKIP